MTMFRCRRSLRTDFVQHFQAIKAWPKRESLRDELNGIDENGIRYQEFSKLRRGEPVPARAVSAFVLYCRIKMADKHSLAGQALQSYIATHGLDPASSPTVPEIVNLISTPVAASAVDAFSNGLEIFRELFFRVSNPESWARPCANEAEVRKAIRWMFIEVGRMMSREKLYPDDAIRIGEQRVATTLADYEERAIAWWRQVPWSVVLGMGPEQRVVGMTVALPLRADAYDDVRAGRRTTYHCGPDQLEFPSSRLLIEGFTMRPRTDPSAAPSPTLPVLVAALCQQAYLTRTPDRGFGKSIHLLAFAGTDTNHERAAQFGFKPTGTVMHNRNIAMLERVVNPKLNYCDGMILGPWRALQYALEAAWNNRKVG